MQRYKSSAHFHLCTLVTELSAISDYTAFCERIDTDPPDVPFSDYQVKDALYVNHFACAYLRMLAAANLHDMVQMTLSVHILSGNLQIPQEYPKWWSR